MRSFLRNQASCTTDSRVPHHRCPRKAPQPARIRVSPHHSAAGSPLTSASVLPASAAKGRDTSGTRQTFRPCQQRTFVDHGSLFVGGAGHSGPTGGSTADLGTRCNGSGHFFHFRIDGDPNCPVVSSQRLFRLCLLSMVYGQASSRVSANAAAVHPQITPLCKGSWLLRGEEHEPWHSPRPPFSLNRSRNPDRQPFFNKSTND